jgi:hypothetical protein
MRDFDAIWVADDGCKKPWIEAWYYDFQAAIYQAVEGNKLPFYIAAATKESEPDIALLEIPQEVLDDRLDMIKSMAPYFQAIKLGLEDPIRCGKCEYCRATKRLTGPIDYREVI